MALTPKQKKFVEAYSGNATEAAITAGYSRNRASEIGYQLLQKTTVSDAIHEREAIESRSRIATRQERQMFWTAIMFDETREVGIRLRASELLAKSEGDFLERVEVAGPPEPPIINVHFTKRKADTEAQE